MSAEHNNNGIWDQVKFFNNCLPQILFGPFLNTLSHLFQTNVMEPDKMKIWMRSLFLLHARKWPICNCRGRSTINVRVLQNFIKNIYNNKMRQVKGIYCRLFWSKLYRDGYIIVLAWVAKISGERAIFKNVLSFCFYSLLHGIIKTFIKSFTRSAFVQYKHHTLPAHLEDVNLLFK